MALKEQITISLTAAMKAGDETRKDTLRSLRALILEFDKKGHNREMTPDEELTMLNTAAKKRKESIEMFESGGRPELAAKEKAELAIIEEFLPKQLSEAEVKEYIKNLISSVGATTAADFPKVMGPAMKELKGKADGKRVQELVKELLGVA